MKSYIDKVKLKLKETVGGIKPLKDFYLKHIKGFDGFIRIYLTLECNLKCEYCTNECHKNNGEDRRSQYAGVDFEKWAQALKRLKLPVVITGGEPSLYPSVIELLNALCGAKIPIKFYTNLVWSKEFTDLWLNEMKNPDVELFVSYHAKSLKPQKFAQKILLLKSNNKFNGIVHTVLTKENGGAVREAVKVFNEAGISLMIDDNYDYLYGESCSQKIRRRVICRKKVIIIAPDGNRYQCISKMVRRVHPLENIFDEACAGFKPQVVSICGDYGFCANCDTAFAAKIKKL
ncbi:MAG: radical SAM protein [Chitinispirillales bacterium]|jgi:organic radical activating enzyme|nr:radical SAM protein [Chitinispirillales bacterium]